MNFDNSKNGHFSHLALVLWKVDKSLYNMLGFVIYLMDTAIHCLNNNIGASYVSYFALHQDCDIQYCSYT